ncbi:MAG: hypothetical protein Q8P25_03915 [Candidatus Curtissbacteria bacterium]|nr:hypothetical protein [Candidatus Curtissbacteria bacterium]
MSSQENLVKNIALSSTVAVISVVLLTLFSELYPPLKNWLASNFSHHWIGKSVLSILIFAVFIIIFQIFKLKNLSPTKAIWILIIVSNLSFVTLLAFFFLETIL